MSDRKTFIFFPLMLVVYEVMLYLSNDMYLPAVPQIIHDLNTSRDWIQLTLTAWFVGSASMQLILGPVADRFGRRPVLLVGSLGFFTATLICALATSAHELMIARVIQGAAVCSAVIAGYSTIHELFDHARAIKTLAWMGSITILAPAFGPLLGALVMEFGTWRTTFWILLFAAVIPVLSLFKLMPETRAVSDRKPIQVKALTQSYINILKNRCFLVNAAAVCTQFSALMAWITAGPVLIIQRYHYSQLHFGIFQLMIFGALILATRALPYAYDRLKTKGLVNAGICCMLMGGTLAVCALFFHPHHVEVFIVAMMLYGFGSGWVFAPLQRLAMEACPGEPMGSKVAMFTLGLSLAGIFGSLMVTLTHNDELITLSWLIFAMAGVTALIKWLVPHPQPPIQHPKDAVELEQTF